MEYVEPAPQRRGSGRTTEQMKRAPKGAIFVWCNDSLTWPKQKARDLGRGDDLIIIGPSVMAHSTERFRGKTYPAIVVDHFLRDSGLDDRQWYGYQILLALVRSA